MGRCAVLLCCLLGTTCLAAEGVAIPTDRDRRDGFDILQPDYVTAEAAVASAATSGSAIVYVFNTGLQAHDGFWTSAGVEAAAQVPVVEVRGGLESTLAKEWRVRELPALVAADQHGNVWARLEGKAVKPAAVQQLMVHAQGLVTRTREQIAAGISEAAEASQTERKLPEAIAALSRWADLAGLPEAAEAQAALDRIVARGLDELRALAALMAQDPPAARRALPKFERLYAGTPLIAQAKRVREGLPIDFEAPAAPAPAADAADEGAVDIFGGE